MRVSIADYCEGWTKRFESLQKALHDALGPLVEDIYHIGSTAVPRLAAKPIIDVLLAVSEVTDAEIDARLEPAGFALIVDEPGHRMFTNAARDVHVHLWAADDPEIGRHLLFRDWLRENEDDRRLYENEKYRLAAMEWPTQNDYAEAKTPVITEILGRARKSRKA